VPPLDRQPPEGESAGGKEEATEPSMAVSTQIRIAVNRLLRPARLQIGTTLLDDLESARFRALQSRGHWDSPRYDQGITLDHAKFSSFLAKVCTDCRDGYTALPQDPGEAGDGFYLRNGWFECVDAEMLYSVVRYFRPGRIIEVGSGFSTRLARKAISDGGLSTQITCIDPQPRAAVQAFADEHIASRVEALPASGIVERLVENDILFIDSSHEIVQGGDVPFLFLEVLPRLRPNVLIHVHDVFFPFDYPETILAQRWRWNEQYLVHAFLAYNTAFEILWPASYMWAQWNEEVLQHIPVRSIANLPSSMWLRKVK
jgi:predicted O-methyltransferase YrrM